MPKVQVITDDGQTVLAEFAIVAEYVPILIRSVQESVDRFVVERETEKLLAKYDAELKDNVNAAVAVVVAPDLPPDGGLVNG